MYGARLVVFVAIALALIAGATLGQIEPLSSGTVGAGPEAVPSPGSYAFSLDGDVNLGGFVFKGGYPFLHNDGGEPAYNTALGSQALVSVSIYKALGTRNTANGAHALQYTTSGWFNTASGAFALQNTTTGYENTAAGAEALLYNTEGYGNTATGFRALYFNTTGHFNTASGLYAMVSNTTGYDNTGIGHYALKQTTTGKRNIGVGAGAGYNNSTGSNNIWIGSFGATEFNTLRIGDGTGGTPFHLSRAFISGIRNATGGGFDQDVCVNSTTDQLGPCDVSSARFKEDIADLDTDSEAVFDLHPVRFRYRADFVGEGVERPTRYGLIAEEVAQIYPQLVTYDAEGKPMTVRYEALTPLLLNELKKQRAEIERLHGLEARLARLEDLEEARKPTPW